MPYIDPESAKRIDAVLPRADLAEAIQTPGDLTYVISVLMAGYIAQRGMRYQYMSDAVHAAEGAVDEFRVRVVRPYERVKRLQGGADPYRVLGV